MSDLTQATDLSLNNSLWEFSTGLYQQPGVESALLALQDKGYEVNCILTLIWLGHQYRLIDEQTLQILRTSSRQSLISPFRDIRKEIKVDTVLKDLYKQFLKLELALEQREIAIYYWQLEKVALERSGTICFIDNLQLYSNQLQKQGSNDFYSLLSLIKN